MPNIINTKMEISKKYYRIREVAELLGVSTSTLRFWENTFSELKPNRTRSGQRRYCIKDIEICKRLKHLRFDRGLTINGAKDAMRAYHRYAPRHAFSCMSSEDAIRLLGDVSKLVNNEYVIARIEAVIKWLREGI